jgi:hypothetical protein
MLHRQLRDVNKKIFNVQHQIRLLEGFLIVKEPKSKSQLQGITNIPGEIQGGRSQLGLSKRAESLLSPSLSPLSSPWPLPSWAASPRLPASPVNGSVQKTSRQLSVPVKPNDRESQIATSPIPPRNPKKRSPITTKSTEISSSSMHASPPASPTWSKTSARDVKPLLARSRLQILARIS